ncbi:dihydroxyacetone phosphate acyltransferase [Manduca sexta]|uniref:dihydroxyacetone phosphate acyltransferase n=2 Tax=Manduca sexta TaxID=7130 RepID=UPI00188E85AD|nr:dihydroxyacetone phosphate acyltransferase [Manduca sexta]
MYEDPEYFSDILEPRREQTGILSFMTRSWKPLKTMEFERNCSPQDLKEIVSKSGYLDALIEAESAKTGASKEKLHKEVNDFLEEMGMDKKMHVIRWMGIIFLKISFMMKIKMFVSQPQVTKLKEIMGSNPVIFLPTHRSYADFCLMTYLCYHYDIELPAVAAGMDFYSMAVLGRRMRETGAFYIRRTLAGAPLYAATLKQYVRTLVSKQGAPVEFFLEGTRSRSNKSLPPKYGMLSMVLMPYFAREVPDITLVPVSINYERLMEDKLFAYEHIGVPKPKESTGGFLKALKSLNDNFGDIYINLAEPISLRSYLDDDVQPRSGEDLKPVDMQQLTADQFKQVQDLAEDMITLQDAYTVVNVSNLVAMTLMQCLMVNQTMSFEDVCEEAQFIATVLLARGAAVFAKDYTKSVEKVLLVHRRLMRLDQNKHLRLLTEPLMDVSDDMKAKMKGYIFDAETLSYALPVIQLQLYVNPGIPCLMMSAILYLIACRGPINECQLASEFLMTRKLLRYEFFYTHKTLRDTYHEELDYCLRQKVIVRTDAGYTTEGGNKKLQLLFRWVACPALATLKACIQTMLAKNVCEHKQALKLIQQRLLSVFSHPYSLSLEATANCLQGLTAYGALEKEKNQVLTYKAVPDILEMCHNTISKLLPEFRFTHNGVVMMEEKTISRL